MRRRRFVLALGAALLTGCIAVPVSAQTTKIARVGILSGASLSTPANARFREAFVEFFASSAGRREGTSLWRHAPLRAERSALRSTRRSSWRCRWTLRSAPIIAITTRCRRMSGCAPTTVVPIRIDKADWARSVDKGLPRSHCARPLIAGTDVLALPSHDQPGRILPPHDPIDILVDHAGLVARLPDELHAVACTFRGVENGRIPKCHGETAIYLAMRQGWSFVRFAERHLLVPLGCHDAVCGLEGSGRRQKGRESVPHLFPVFGDVHVAQLSPPALRYLRVTWCDLEANE